MAISFSPSFYPGGFNPIIPATGNTPAPGITSTLGSVNTAPVSTPSLSQLTSQFSSSLSPAGSVTGTLRDFASDPRLSALIDAGVLRANQSDDEIGRLADQAYQTQRKVAEAEANKQTTRSLAANGVLPTGGLASQYYSEISAPLFDRINAQRAQTELDLRGARDNARNGITSTLAGIDSNKNQFTLSQLQAQQQAQYQAQQLAASQAYNQAQLQQQSALASQQLAAEQARAQQSNALAQAQLDYQRQSDQQRLAFEQQQANLARQDRLSQSSLSGNGYGGAAGGGITGSLNTGFSLGADDTAQMQAAYHRNIANDVNTNSRFPVGYQQPTQHPTTSSSSTPQNTFQGSSMNSSNGSAAPGMQSIYNNSSITGTLAGGSGWSAPSTTSFYTPPSANGGSGFTSPTSMFYYS